MRAALPGVGVALLLGCTRAGPAESVTVAAARHGAAVTVTLQPAPGVRISAVLPPALELAGGRVVRLGAARDRADTTYFAAAPSAEVAAVPAGTAATLRASICEAGARVCRQVTRALVLR